MSAPYCGEYQRDYPTAPTVGAETDVDGYGDCAGLCSASSDCKAWYLKVNPVEDTKKCQLRGEVPAGATATTVSKDNTW